MHWAESVRKYVREYELNTVIRSTDQKQRWLIGLSTVKKRAKLQKIQNGNDIRRYMV